MWQENNIKSSVTHSPHNPETNQDFSTKHKQIKKSQKSTRKKNPKNLTTAQHTQIRSKPSAQHNKD